MKGEHVSVSDVHTIVWFFILNFYSRGNTENKIVTPHPTHRVPFTKILNFSMEFLRFAKNLPRK
jgi:hypothetical protein